MNGSTSEGTLVWFQTCGTGYPAFSGKTVYYDAAKTPQYYNLLTEITLTVQTAAISNLSENAVLVLASYKAGRLIDTRLIDVSPAKLSVTIAETGLVTADVDEIRAFLWKDMTSIRPLCESAIYPPSEN